MVLKHLVLVERLETQGMVGDIDQRGHRKGADDLAAEHLDTIACCFGANRLEHTKQWRVPEVGHVHRHLDDASLGDLESHGLHVAIPTR